MMEKLKQILRESGCDGWEITDVKTHGNEYYFIGHSLDQNRVKEVRHVMLNVYKKSEDGKFLGKAGAEICPDDPEELLKKQVAQLVYNASLIRNPLYTLNPARPAVPMERKSISRNDISRDFIRLMQQVPETENEYINSYEIFVSEKEIHFENSEGADLSESYPVSMMEVVVNAKNENHEIELYRMYRSGECAAERILEDLAKTMQTGRDRLHTKPTPNLKKAPVIFSGEQAVRIAEFFLDHTDAAFIYQRMSDWKKEEPYAKEIQGDTVTLKALKTLENSPANRSFDAEGAPIRDLVLIEEGTVKNYHGSRMFSCGIGLEDSFIVSNFELCGGTYTEEQLREGTYLEAMEFSDFQVDSLTGDIFGEIRLAYLHENGTVTPLSGGSVSGNMNELLKQMRMSRKMKTVASAAVPALIRLENVTVSGE